MPLSLRERGASERSEIVGYAHGDAPGYPLVEEMSGACPVLRYGGQRGYPLSLDGRGLGRG